MSYLQPVLVLDDLPECVLVDDLVALEAVDVAALVIEVLAVGALAAHRPYRDRPIAGQDVVLVLPAHIGDLLEAVGERLSYRRLALQGAPDRFRPARQAKHPVFGKALDDALDIAAVERRRDLPHQLQLDHFRCPSVLDTFGPSPESRPGESRDPLVSGISGEFTARAAAQAATTRPSRHCR